MDKELSAVVAGHLCLDIIPGLGHLQSGEFLRLFQPGHLIEVGPAAFSTGGAVPNTGLALHRLGVRTQLIAIVGSDLFTGAPMTTGVALDDALLEPASLRAVTTPNNRCPASARARTYVFPVAPSTARQPLTEPSQRIHRYENAIGCVPSQVPVERLNLDPC